MTDADQLPRRSKLVQWIGAALIVIGALLFTVYVLGRFGVVPPISDDGIPYAVIVISGAMVLTTARHSTPLSPATKRRRLMILGIGAAVFAITLALVILVSKGA